MFLPPSPLSLGHLICRLDLAVSLSEVKGDCYCLFQEKGPNERLRDGESIGGRVLATELSWGTDQQGLGIRANFLLCLLPLEGLCLAGQYLELHFRISN